MKYTEIIHSCRSCNYGNTLRGEMLSINAVSVSDISTIEFKCLNCGYECTLTSILITELSNKINRSNYQWWHDNQGNKLERNKGELLCLIHSEISEAMEGERKSKNDDYLPHRPMAEVELADAIIRILDYSSGFGYDVAGAMMEKLEFNKTRKDHTREEREKVHGKKF